jgi:hypothetical protein
MTRRSKALVGEGASKAAEALMSLFVFYIVITVHNLLTLAPHLLQNIENGHHAHQAIGLTRHRASFWARLGLAYLMRTTGSSSFGG